MNTSYPDFTDGKYTLAEIEAWCNKYDVQFIPVYEETSEYPAGKIYKQSQTKGTTVMGGQTLKIYIASEPEQEEELGEDEIED